jgi:hypothetical protein
MKTACGQILCCFVGIIVSFSFEATFKQTQKLLLVLREKAICLFKLEGESISFH